MVLIQSSELKTGEGYSADIYDLTRDICLFQDGRTHMQSELLQETGAKKGCGRQRERVGETPRECRFCYPSANAWLHDQ